MLSAANVAAFLFAVALQLVMISLLPATRGYTVPLPTFGAVLCMNLAIFLLARLTAAGVQLSILVPLSGTIIPLGAIALGVLVYGEPAPPLKIALLVVASGLIGWASAV